VVVEVGRTMLEGKARGQMEIMTKEDFVLKLCFIFFLKTLEHWPNCSIYIRTMIYSPCGLPCSLYTPYIDNA
jgi:hypothetical protein